MFHFIRPGTSIVAKLSIVSLLITTTIVGIVAVNFFAFQDVERLLMTMLNRDVGHIVRNAKLGREFSSILAETNVFISTFTERGELVTSDGEQLFASLQRHVTDLQAEESHLHDALQEFQESLRFLFQQCMTVHTLLTRLQTVEENLNRHLQILDQTVVEKVLTIALEERTKEEVLSIEQLNNMLSVYQEILNEIIIQTIRSQQAHLGTGIVKEAYEEQILALLDELYVSLGATTAEWEDVQPIIEQFMDAVLRYKDLIIAFHTEMREFQARVKALENTQKQVVATIGRVDEEIARKTRDMGENITGNIRTSVNTTMMLSGMIILALIVVEIATLRMIRPIKQLARVAEKLSEGDIYGETRTMPFEKASDEIGRLAAAFHKLIAYNEHMAHIATAISCGDFSNTPQPRSERDVLGHAFLNMSAYLRELAQSATAIAEGDFHRKIHPKSPQDVLGNAFHIMALRLNQNFDTITTQLQEIRQVSEERERLVRELRKNNDALHHEITERERTERVLWDERNLLRTLIDNVPDAIYVKNTHCQFLLANIAVARLMGAETPDDLLGKTDLDFYPEDEAQQYYADEQAMMTSGRPLIDYEETVLNAQGNRVWLSSTKVPWRNTRGELLGFVGISRDITWRKQAEIELLLAKDVAETANRAKSQFLANMSHELRTPLNAILGFVQVMARGPHTPEERENLRIIQHSGEHLLLLINQVLNLSKIETGQITLNAKNFDLYHLLDGLEDMIRLPVEDKGLQLYFERSDSVPRYICTDEVKLREILLNLLNNAVKFTSKGGVRVEVTSERAALRNSHPATCLFFAITDTGPGIRPEELNTLFETFTQTDTGRKSGEGSGLGLSISRKFAQLMGGDITVSSVVGQGSTFTCMVWAEVVDAHSVNRLAPARPVVALEPGQPAYRLLIVDDVPTNRKLLIKILAPLGFELREAENGQEAIDLVNAWKPHLIWMDMRMPVMDGYEATKQIKRGEEQTVIIAVTASSFDEQREHILAAGCDDFLRKPFREEELFELLHKHLGMRFVYAKGGEQPLSKGKYAARQALTSAALAALPSDLLTQLERAAVIADIGRIAELNTTIRLHNAALADALEILIDDFEYSQILSAIQAMQSP